MPAVGAHIRRQSGEECPGLAGPEDSCGQCARHKPRSIRPGGDAAAGPRRHHVVRAAEAGATNARGSCRPARTVRGLVNRRGGNPDADARAQFVRSRASSGGRGSARMSDPTSFLHAFAQALSVLSLYPEGHPSRERAIDSAYQSLDALTNATTVPAFTFLEGEVVYGREPLREFKDWDWGYRLAAAGIERLQVERTVSRDEFEGFLQEINTRLTMSSASTSENRQMRSLGIRFGSVGVKGHSLEVVKTESSGRAPNAVSLAEELETLKWLQDEVQSERAVPLIEAEAIVRSLSVTMHAERGTVLPLLQLKNFDQYTTTHSLNVSVLSMAVAESIGCRKPEVRALGMAGLLHDIGKI